MVRQSTALRTTLVTGLLVALGVHLALSVANVPLYGDDAHLHLDWIDQFVRLRAEGILYPRWLPQSFAGLGSTTFYFYPPLPYFLASFLYTCGFATTSLGLYHALEILSVLGSLAAMYAYLRHHTVRRRQAFTGAALYSVGLYHFVDIFYRNALSEQFAFIWLPLVFLGLDYARSTLSSGRFRTLVLSAIAWWALVLTNIPMLIMTLLASALYAAVAFRGQYAKLWRPLAGCALAALMAGFYLLPLLSYVPLLNRGHVTDYVKGGVRWGYILLEIFHAEIPKRPPHALLPLVMGVAIIATLVLLRHERKRLESGWLAVSIAALLLQVPFVSAPLWNWLPPLQLLQFSWRLCALLTVVPVIAFVSFWSKSPTLRWTLGLYSLLIAGWYIHYVTVIRSNVYEPFHLSAARLGAPEYVPKWADHPTIDIIDSIATERAASPFLQHSGDAQLEWEDTSSSAYVRTIHHSTSRPASVGARLYYWPYWKASLADGSHLHVYPTSEGFLGIDLPPGNTTFTLTLTADSSEHTGWMLTAAGFAILTLLCVAGMYRTGGLPRFTRARVRTATKKAHRDDGPSSQQPA